MDLPLEFFAFVPIVCVGYFPLVFLCAELCFAFSQKMDSWQGPSVQPKTDEAQKSCDR